MMMNSLMRVFRMMIWKLLVYAAAYLSSSDSSRSEISEINKLALF